MDLKELFTSKGLTVEQADSVLAAMKENKIFTSTQENLDIRYEKLKTKHDDLAVQISTANAAVENLKKNNTDNKALQESLDKYKLDFEALQKDSDAKIKGITIDTQIKNYMKEFKVKDKYDELLMSKIDRTALQLDDKGSAVGLDEIFKGLKTEYSDLFAVEPPKLGGNKPADTGFSIGNDSALAEQIKNSIFKK